jgi:hypothetical protein
MSRVPVESMPEPTARGGNQTHHGSAFHASTNAPRVTQLQINSALFFGSRIATIRIALH